jgi:uncharacterized protein (TIGR02246 family)
MPNTSREDPEIKNILVTLWNNWVTQDLEQFVALFSEDTDWENAFGWRLRGRERLKEFLRDFLWPRQAGSQYGPVSYRVEFLTPELAVAEYGVERRPPPNSPLRKRLARLMHILAKGSGRWEVVVTRIWDPLTDMSPPADRFPEFKDAPLSEMRPLL